MVLKAQRYQKSQDNVSCAQADTPSLAQSHQGPSGPPPNSPSTTSTVPRELLTVCHWPDRHTRDLLASFQRSTTQATWRSPASLTSTVLGQLQAPAPPHPHPQACPSIGQAVGYSEPGFVPVSCWPPCQPGAGAGTDLIWQLQKRVVGTGWGGGGGQDTHP